MRPMPQEHQMPLNPAFFPQMSAMQPMAGTSYSRLQGPPGDFGRPCPYFPVQKYPSGDTWMRSSKSGNRRSFVCTYCKKVYYTSVDLEHHKAQIHKIQTFKRLSGPMPQEHQMPLNPAFFPQMSAMQPMAGTSYSRLQGPPGDFGRPCPYFPVQKYPSGDTWMVQQMKSQMREEKPAEKPKKEKMQREIKAMDQTENKLEEYKGKIRAMEEEMKRREKAFIKAQQTIRRLEEHLKQLQIRHYK